MHHCPFVCMNNSIVCEVSNCNGQFYIDLHGFGIHISPISQTYMRRLVSLSMLISLPHISLSSGLPMANL